jgi:hypothetical protein
MNELTPEVNEALRQLHEHSKAVMEALADLARQGCYEFKQHPGGEYIDRDEAMRNVIRLRDAHTRMSHHARAALVAAGRIAGVAAVAPSDEAEFCIEGAGGMFLASSQGPRAEAWREIQHYAAQYHDEGPLTIYEVTRRPVTAAGVAPAGEPSWWAASLNRRATVEQWMFDAARGKRPMPTPDELRAWAIKLGTPADGEPAPGVTPTRGGQNRGA